MKNIKDIKLNTKILLISSFKLVLFSVIFAVIFWCLYQNTQKWNEFQEVHMRSITTLYSVHKSIGFNCGIHSFKNYLLRGKPFYYKKSKECFDEALTTLGELERDQRFKDDVEVIKSTINLYTSMLENIKVSIEEGSFESRSLDKVVKIDDEPAQKALSDLENKIITGAYELKNEVKDFQDSYLLYIAVLFIIGFAMVLSMNLYLGSNIVKNISILQESARKISKGELNLKITNTSSDEIGQLARSLDIMRVKLKKYVRELKNSNKELEQFAFVTSHDLQEPLRKIISFGELLEKSMNGHIDEKSKSYLEKIINSSLRMRTLIDDLLSYSRVSSVQNGFKDVDLVNVINGVIGDLELSIQQANAQIKIDSIPMVYADPAQMRQLFQNLISNSLKFRRESVDSSISITCETLSSKKVHIAVKDNGIGIDEKYYERIFAPFQRLHSRTEYDGTGIGLALCHKIVARHGGKLKVHSKLNEGSSFSFDLQII